MKPKKFEKKLALKKKTIANLSNGQLGNVKGGIETDPNCTIVEPTEQSCPVTVCRHTCKITCGKDCTITCFVCTD
jgi:hypothetical protein